MYVELQASGMNPTDKPDYLPTETNDNAHTVTLAELRDQISKDYYSLESHLAYIEALKVHGTKRDVDDALDRVSKEFLPPQDWWDDWIKRAGDGPEHRHRTHAAAVSIPSVHFFGQYLQAGQQYIGSADSFNHFDEMRKCYEMANNKVKYWMHESHKLWDVFYRHVIENLRKEEDEERSAILKVVKELFLDRLRTPHNQLEQTFADYSTFISTFFNANYEEELVAAKTIEYSTRKAVEYREQWEQLIDQDPSLQNFAEYIQWEMKRPPKYTSLGFVQALYERTLENFTYVPEVWDDYIYYMLKNEVSDDELLLVIRRASRACPKSGILLAHKLRIYRVVGDKDSLFDLEKHARDVLKPSENYHDYKMFYLAWIKFLAEETEARGTMYFKFCTELLNIAHSFGQNDPTFALERAVIDLYGSNSQVVRGREAWEKVSKYHGLQADLWLQRFEWEKLYANHDVAKGVLYKALARTNIDFPEKIYDALLNYTLTRGSMEEYQNALVTCRFKAAEVAQQRQHIEASNSASTNSKRYSKGDSRKRRRDVEQDDAQPTSPSKKRISDLDLESFPSHYQEKEKDTVNGHSKTGRVQPQSHKRNREHCSVIVSNLCASTSEDQLRSLFSSSGQIVSIAIAPSHTKDSNYAIIEFSSESETLAAVSFTSTQLDGNQIAVKSAENTSLWVNNYGPNVSHDDIRHEFSKFGEIVSTRFPSLDFKTKRRFCYIQFADPQQAQEAVNQLDASESLGSLKLDVKLSKPELAEHHTESSPASEGREVIVRKLDFYKGEEEVRREFEKYGKIQRVTLVKDKTGKHSHRGFGFVVFSSADAARASVAMNGKRFGKTALEVELAQPKTVNQPNPETTSRKREPSTNEHSLKDHIITISGLPVCDKQEIEDLVKVYGPVRSINSNDSEAIVYYESEQAVGAAFLGLQGKAFKGTVVSVTTAPKSRTSSNSRFIPRQTRRR